MNSRLTLNLGLRWDYNPTQTEEHNRMFSFSPTAIDPATGLPGALTFAGNCAGCIGSPRFVDQHHHNFGPRVGFAFQLNTKTVIRSAYGVFFADRAPNDYFGDPNCSVACNGWGWGVSNVVNNPGNLAQAFNWDNGYPGVAAFTTPNPSQAETRAARFTGRATPDALVTRNPGTSISSGSCPSRWSSMPAMSEPRAPG